MSRPSSIARAALLFLAAGLASSCAGGPDGVVLLVDAEPAGISRIGVRVWDTAEELVADAWLRVGPEAEVSLPWELTLTPEGGELGRRYRVEVDLFDEGLCPTHRATASGVHEAGVARVRLEFRPLGDACHAVRFVDGGSAAAMDDARCGTEASPCRSIGWVLDERLSDAAPSGAEIVFVRGGVDYEQPGLIIGRGRAGHPGAPLVIRAWPGTGRPHITGSGSSFATVEVVGTLPSADPVGHVVLDGLRVTGGERVGVSLNGVVDCELRHSVVEDNGPPAVGAGIFAGVALANNPQGVSVEHNRIRRNTLGVNAVGMGGELGASGQVVQNVIEDNHQDGVRLGQDGLVLAVRVERNVVCQNGGAGVVVRGPLETRPGAEGAVRFNSVVGNAAGIDAEQAGGAVVLEGNLLTNNRGPGLTGAPLESNYASENGDGGDDPPPEFFDRGGCVLVPRPTSPALGAGAY